MVFVVNMDRTREIVDVIHGLIAYSGIEHSVIGTPIFNRLHRILQNSLVYLTYPSNKVKRFEHSVGTMHLAGQLFFHSVCNSAPEELERFFAEVNTELISWNQNVTQQEIGFVHGAVRAEFGGEKILNAPFPQCRLYIQNRPLNLEKKYLFGYYVAYQAIRLVGLLHDVGHLPYSHVLEHSLQLLYQRVNQIPAAQRNDAHKYFLEVMTPYCSSTDPEFAIHEQLGQKFVDKIFECITESLPRGEKGEYYFLAAVIHFTKAILSAGERDNCLFSDLHGIVAGTLDCDRMDYCCRDEFCAGVSKELPCYDRILASVSIVYHMPEKGIMYEKATPDDRNRCCFVPSTKAIPQIEALLRRRWNIFATINYHHRVHKHELLLEEALAQLGLQEMERDKERPKPLKTVFPLEVSAIWQLVAQMSGAAPVEYIALQLDDSWLDTLLKYKYFEAYSDTYLSFSKNGNDVMWHRLDELISVQKHYHSLIKRSGNFRRFDEFVYNGLAKQGTSELLDLLGIQSGERYSQYINDNGEYVFNRALREIAPDKQLRSHLFRVFNQRVQDLVKPIQNPYQIADCFLADSSFSMGIQLTDPLYIAAPGQKEKPFVRYSALYNALSCEKKLLPSVHIYYLPKYDTEHSEYCCVDTTSFLEAAAETAVKTIAGVWEEKGQAQPLPREKTEAEA